MSRFVLFCFGVAMSRTNAAHVGGSLIFLQMAAKVSLIMLTKGLKPVGLLTFRGVSVLFNAVLLTCAGLPSNLLHFLDRSRSTRAICYSLFLPLTQGFVIVGWRCGVRGGFEEIVFFWVSYLTKTWKPVV